eukprot:TRINITY_DN89_c0_g1_i1.p1 TRINITY_DN89_c0_g1~~TRINITY_DN89_c0_g1_i1.p1  ORF type:complete len:232 (-),score=52.89 TRINITY_DN89_c0_g1_i1:91-786(-)
MASSVAQKQAAGLAAAALVKSGQKLGIGTGSTAEFFIKALGERITAENLNVSGVPTSEKSASLMKSAGIPVSTLDDTPELDLAIDGADEWNDDLALIKGGGGAMLREKIVASCARSFIVIVDDSKYVKELGAFKLPVEVIKMAKLPVERQLQALGAAVTLRQTPEAETFITDEGNYILDCAFGRIPNPAQLANKLAGIAGVVEHGLFVRMASKVIIGTADGGVRVVDGLDL